MGGAKSREEGIVNLRFLWTAKVGKAVKDLNSLVGQVGSTTRFYNGGKYGWG
jgi:hypothetical protein